MRRAQVALVVALATCAGLYTCARAQILRDNEFSFDTNGALPLILWRAINDAKTETERQIEREGQIDRQID